MQLLHELGSKCHLERLTITMGHPDKMKDNMFTGNKLISVAKNLAISPDEQLQAVTLYSTNGNPVQNPVLHA